MRVEKFLPEWSSELTELTTPLESGIQTPAKVTCILILQSHESYCDVSHKFIKK